MYATKDFVETHICTVSVTPSYGNQEYSMCLLQYITENRTAAHTAALRQAARQFLPSNRKQEYSMCRSTSPLTKRQYMTCTAAVAAAVRSYRPAEHPYVIILRFNINNDLASQGRGVIFLFHLLSSLVFKKTFVS